MINKEEFKQGIGSVMVIMSTTSLVVMSYRLTDRYMDWVLNQKSRKDKNDK